MDKQEILAIIRNDMGQATGTTETAAVAYMAARACAELSGTPQRIKLSVSPNVYKGIVSIGVPGTGEIGSDMSIAMGAVMKNHEDMLSLLEKGTSQNVSDARLFLENVTIETSICNDAPDMLYFRLEAFYQEESAAVTIMNDYDNVTEVTKNGAIVFENKNLKANESHDNVLKLLNEYGLRGILEICRTMKLEELQFLLDAAENNKKAALQGLDDENLIFGRALMSYQPCFGKPYNVVNKAKAMTAAAGEARCAGLLVTINTIVGSGNHGITNFLGVLAAAEELGVSKETAAQALAMSSVVTSCIKSVIKRVTAFCGCAMSAAIGVSAATVYMLGGTYEQQELAMQTVIGTLGGILCDGGKVSCAYKLSTAVSMAIEYSLLAVQNVGLESGIGILGKTIEASIYNLDILNNPGMAGTEEVMLDIIMKNQEK